MIDLRQLRENPDVVREAQRARRRDDAIVDAVLEADSRWREATAAFESAQRYAWEKQERSGDTSQHLQANPTAGEYFRKKEREEKLARGEEVGPEEPDPTEEVEVGCMGLLKFILYATLFVLLAGKFFTGSFLWELDVPDLRQFIPVRSRANPLPSSCSVPARPRPCARVGRAASCVVGSSSLSLC